MKKLRHPIKENRTIVDIVCLFVIAFMLALPLFRQENDIFLDDGSQHLMRAFGTYQAILRNGTGTIISDFASGFGYSWNLFYGFFSTDFILLISHIIGTFNVGFKISLLLIIFLAGSMMYKLVKELTENKDTACLAAILYMTSPYFFTDIYVRHAVGEAMAFVFLPMVFLGLYNLFNTEKNHYYFIFGSCGLILSHNIATVLTVIFAGIYCVVNIKNLASTRVKKGLAMDIIFILLITSLYWMPLLETKFSANYRVYEPNAMASKESFMSHTLKLKDLFIASKNSTLIFEIGLPVLLMLIFSSLAFHKLEENKKEYLFFLISGIISTWMTTKYFFWKWLPDSCYIIQFPWRMLLFSSFFFALVASMNMAVIIKKFNVRDVFILSIIAILYIFSRHYAITYSDNVPKTEQYEIMQVSGQNNEWLPGMGRLEYLPSRAYQNTFYMATREKGIVPLEGKCQIKEEVKVGTHFTAKISTEGEVVQLELPYVYYPGYTVRLDGMLLEIFETEHGFLGCYIENKENGTLEIQYTGTKIMNISKILSISAFITYIIYVWKKH